MHNTYNGDKLRGGRNVHIEVATKIIKWADRAAVITTIAFMEIEPMPKTQPKLEMRNESNRLIVTITGNSFGQQLVLTTLNSARARNELERAYYSKRQR